MSDYEFYERLVSVFTPQMISSKDSSFVRRVVVCVVVTKKEVPQCMTT